MGSSHSDSKKDNESFKSAQKELISAKEIAQSLTAWAELVKYEAQVTDSLSVLVDKYKDTITYIKKAISFSDKIKIDKKAIESEIKHKEQMISSINLEVIEIMDIMEISYKKFIDIFESLAEKKGNDFSTIEILHPKEKNMGKVNLKYQLQEHEKFAKLMEGIQKKMLKVEKSIKIDMGSEELPFYKKLYKYLEFYVAIGVIILAAGLIILIVTSVVITIMPILAPIFAAIMKSVFSLVVAGVATLIVSGTLLYFKNQHDKGIKRAYTIL